MPSIDNEISILVPRLVTIATLAPYARGLYSKGFRVHAYGPRHVLKTFRAEAPSPDHLVLHEIEPLLRARKWQKNLHTLLLLALTPKNFSSAWPRFVQLLMSRNGTAANLLIYLATAYPLKTPANDVNRAIDSIMRRIFKNPFNTPAVITTTTGGYDHLLASAGIKKLSILESWDQVTKQPVGYYANSIHVWSHKLKRDWELYQGAEKVYVGYPTKLWSLIHTCNSLRRKTAQERTTWMYAATFCKDSQPHFYNEECRLIHALAAATKNLGVELFIKPKPNGTPGEFYTVTEGFSHVRFGAYQDRRFGADYHLSSQYNETRASELACCHLVIHVGTTFAFEAAATGLPIVQLRLLENGDFPALSNIQQNHHLQEHFLDNTSLTHDLRYEKDISVLSELLATGENTVMMRATGFSQKLRDFIRPEHDLDKAVQAFVQECETFTVPQST